MAVLPGVTSRNSVVILKQGSGIDGDAAYHKFGINYSMNLARSEGQSAGAARAGRAGGGRAHRQADEDSLLDLPGRADPKTERGDTLEMFDWYYAMAATRVELIAYFQNQLRRRGFYDGPIDGEFNPAIDEAIANYRAALGLSREAVLNEEFFYAFLAADHTKIKRPDAAGTLRRAGPGCRSRRGHRHVPRHRSSPPQPPPAAPLKLSLTTPKQQTRFARGEAIKPRSRAVAGRACLLLSAGRGGQGHPLLPQPIRPRLTHRCRPSRSHLPGAMRFQLTMNPKGVPETISCFATPRDVVASLPQALVGTDFEPLPGATLELIRAAFVKASGGTLAQENFRVQAK